jgi:hypothetical protein
MAHAHISARLVRTLRPLCISWFTVNFHNKWVRLHGGFSAFYSVPLEASSYRRDKPSVEDATTDIVQC